jgi:hypothetical protein
MKKSQETHWAESKVKEHRVAAIPDRVQDRRDVLNHSSQLREECGQGRLIFRRARTKFDDTSAFRHDVHRFQTPNFDACRGEEKMFLLGIAGEQVADPDIGHAHGLGGVDQVPVPEDGVRISYLIW